MIHAYNENDLYMIQKKVSEMFEYAVYGEKLDIDEFSSLFSSSPISKALETADPIYACGKSSNELLGLVLNKAPIQIEISNYASPEYWVGFVLSYAQWELNKTYKEILSSISASKLIEYFHPYHEMDITKSVELIQSYLNNISPLIKYRKKKNLSQNDLAILSGVPIRTIKSYEQNTVDISKAQAQTLYALSKVLNCTIEDLIK